MSPRSKVPQFCPFMASLALVKSGGILCQCAEIVMNQSDNSKQLVWSEKALCSRWNASSFDWHSCQMY